MSFKQTSTGWDATDYHSSQARQIVPYRGYALRLLAPAFNSENILHFDDFAPRKAIIRRLFLPSPCLSIGGSGVIPASSVSGRREFTESGGLQVELLTDELSGITLYNFITLFFKTFNNILAEIFSLLVNPTNGRRSLKNRNLTPQATA